MMLRHGFLLMNLFFHNRLLLLQAVVYVANDKLRLVHPALSNHHHAPTFVAQGQTDDDEAFISVDIYPLVHCPAQEWMMVQEEPWIQLVRHQAPVALGTESSDVAFLSPE